MSYDDSPEKAAEAIEAGIRSMQERDREYAILYKRVDLPITNLKNHDAEAQHRVMYTLYGQGDRIEYEGRQYIRYYVILSKKPHITEAELNLLATELSQTIIEPIARL